MINTNVITIYFLYVNQHNQSCNVSFNIKTNLFSIKLNIKNIAYTF